MTDQQKLALVQKLVRKWAPRLHLEHWRISIELPDDQKEDNRIQTTASCACLHEYQSAVLKVYPIFFDEPSSEQEYIIVHELCHCLTGEYKSLYQKTLNFEVVPTHHENEVNEKLTSWIAKLVFDAHS